MVEPVTTTTAILSFVVGIISWFSSLPNWVKWVVFIGGLAVDATFFAGITNFIGLGNQGIIGWLMTTVGHILLGMPSSFMVYSWQVLILSGFLPFIFYLLETHST